MKTIGLLGGMSWASSIEYYRIINETVRERLGGLHSAQCLMYSVDFAEIEVLQHEGRWEEAATILAQASRNLERAGAGCVVLCTNTMHKLADSIQSSVAIPFLHIADPTAEAICARGLDTIGLLGTRFTMEEDFYTGRLAGNYGLKVLIPTTEERQFIHKVIFEELVIGKICQSSKEQYLEIINRMVEGGAQGIILGCTEIGLLVKPEDCSVPVFDTTLMHAQAAVDWALQEQ